MTAVTRVDLRRHIAMTRGDIINDTHVDKAPNQPERIKNTIFKKGHYKVLIVSWTFLAHS